MCFQGQLGLAYGQPGYSHLPVPAKVDRARVINVAQNLAPPIKKFLAGMDGPDEVVARTKNTSRRLRLNFR
jgi:hypothetical protein